MGRGLQEENTYSSSWNSSSSIFFFLILRAARNYSKSVLKPGEDILLLGIWEKHRDESEVHDSLFYEPNLHNSMNGSHAHSHLDVTQCLLQAVCIWG